MKCRNCSNDLNRKNQKYCDQDCQLDFQHKAYITRWKNGNETGIMGKYFVSRYIRTYLFEKHDSKCSKCSWSELNPVTGKVPLHIDHIDGDFLNNVEDNLQLLCPNCHSLTENFGSLNKSGNGRRKKGFMGDNPRNL